MARRRTPGVRQDRLAPRPADGTALPTIAGAPAPSRPDRPAEPHRSDSQPPGLFPLVTTKLYAPRPRADLVSRPRLLERLDAGLDSGRCTLLSAPAGAGKSSLLAAWLVHLHR